MIIHYLILLFKTFYFLKINQREKKYSNATYKFLVNQKIADKIKKLKSFYVI